MASVISPGNIVVPLSSIIDQLRGRLTSSEIDVLLNAIVSRRRSEVHPGDLITSDLINQILKDLQDLSAQVAALAGGGTGTRNAQAVVTLHETWSFYGGLVKSGEFISTGVGSAVQITTYLQDVMYAALAGATLGYFGDATSLLEVFRRLYLRQRDVVSLFSATIPGISDTTRHRRFATLLNIALEQDAAQGALSLHAAVDAQDLGAAIAAQNRINGIVRDEGGDVTTGTIEVLYNGAVGGSETLVLGSTQPVVYRFTVNNRTNRALDADLSAQFLPPRQAWNQLSVVDALGAALSGIRLAAFDPARPNDPATTQEVRVAVMTPSGAANGDTGTLQLTAFAPPPINRRGTATRTLTVANVSTPQTPGAVTLDAGAPQGSGNLSNAGQLEAVTFDAGFSFASLTGPSTRQFRFRIDVSAPADPTPFFFFELGSSGPGSAVGIDNSASTTTRIVSAPFSMSNGTRRNFTIAVTPLNGSVGQSLTFTVTVESATDGIRAQSPSRTITVTH